MIKSVGAIKPMNPSNWRAQVRPAKFFSALLAATDFAAINLRLTLVFSA